MKRTSRVAPAVAVDVRVRMAALATDLACLVDSFRSNREAPPAHSGAHRACTLAICSPFLCVCFTWSMVFRILCCSCGDHGCLKCSDACIVNTCDATFKKRTLSRVDASDLVDFAKAPEGAEKTALLAALADLAAYMKTVAADADLKYRYRVVVALVEPLYTDATPSNAVNTVEAIRRILSGPD